MTELYNVQKRIIEEYTIKCENIALEDISKIINDLIKCINNLRKNKEKFSGASDLIDIAESIKENMIEKIQQFCPMKTVPVANHINYTFYSQFTNKIIEGTYDDLSSELSQYFENTSSTLDDIIKMDEKYLNSTTLMKNTYNLVSDVIEKIIKIMGTENIFELVELVKNREIGEYESDDERESDKFIKICSFIALLKYDTDTNAILDKIIELYNKLTFELYHFFFVQIIININHKKYDLSKLEKLAQMFKLLDEEYDLDIFDSSDRDLVKLIYDNGKIITFGIGLEYSFPLCFFFLPKKNCCYHIILKLMKKKNYRQILDRTKFMTR